MASTHVFVVDASLKRTQIKVTPGSYLREVLEDACKMRKLDPEAYMLKTQNNKIVDLSQPFRLSGLASGAKLQLTQASRSPAVVNVALQLPDSEKGETRVSDKFPSTTSLWQVLRKFEDAVAGQSSQKLNFTQRGVAPDVTSGSGRLEYDQPCIHIMGRNLETFTDLQKTLAQYGINGGSVLLRLTFKRSGRPLDQAMAEIEQYFHAGDSSKIEPEAAMMSNERGTDTQATGFLATANAPNSQDPLSSDGHPTKVIPTQVTPTDSAMTGIDSNTTVDELAQPTAASPGPPIAAPLPQSSKAHDGITVFRAPTLDTPAAALHQDDPSTFEPSIEHAKAHQAALQRATRNNRLLSDAELASQEAERQAQLSAVHRAVVRVRFPDQSMTQFEITTTDSGADLYARARKALRYQAEPFDLRTYPTTGPSMGRGAVQQITLEDTTKKLLIRDWGFRGKMLVTLVWVSGTSETARKAPCLNEEYSGRAEDLKVELTTHKDEGRGNSASAGSGKPQGSQGEADDNKGKGKGDLEAKMKKFLRFGKK